MIVAFHLFINYVVNLVSKNNAKDTDDIFDITSINAEHHPLPERGAENDIRFDPPLYKQRYERAAEIIMNEKWKGHIKKLVEFGCAEFNFFVFLKNTLQMSELSFVDIDDALLRDSLYKVYPLNADYLSRRKEKLTVNVFAGSIADPDPFLVNTDAVVGLEIVEHLFPDVLEAVPYNIFSYVRPKLVIFTTPNSEFNILFEKLNRFRHADHKFEWTREQFESWATNITLRFPSYIVRFDGIGLSPVGFEHLGCCSQLAVFIRKDICDNYTKENLTSISTESTCNLSNSSSDCNPKYSYGICTYLSHSKEFSPKYEPEQVDHYKFVTKIEYPYYVDNRTDEEKNIDELKYRVNLFIHGDEFYNCDENRWEIPLNIIANGKVGHVFDILEIRNLLVKLNYKIEECINQDTKVLETCVIYEPEMDNSDTSGNDTDASGYESDTNKYVVEEGHISDWDESNASKSDKEDAPCPDKEDAKAQLHLEMNVTKKQQEALYDSGYQKSPSASDESPRQPFAAVSSDFKGPSNEKPTKPSNLFSVYDNFDKINELDTVRRDRKHFNFASNLPHKEIMKKICQEIAKHPVAGPSRDPKKSKPKKSQSSDSDESADDVKSITTCILENSLNKIEINEERRVGELIQELILEEIPVEAPVEIQVQEAIPEGVLVVENGDLANNNRDREGNNYVAPNPLDDNAVDNIEVNNVNIDNNNEIEEPVLVQVVEEAEEIAEENIEIEPLVDAEVAWSSREALFDANSQVDLLEDFEMDGAAANGVVFPNSYIVQTDPRNVTDDAVLPLEDTGFPNWLLQIFEDGEVLPPEDDLHDEPHYYCQGDGLGVHPSTVALDDDDDDDGNESGSDSSSSSGSVDFAVAENHSLAELLAPQGSRTENLAVVGQPMTIDHPVSQTSSEPEVFESAESESTLVLNDIVSEL